MVPSCHIFITSSILLPLVMEIATSLSTIIIKGLHYNFSSLYYDELPKDLKLYINILTWLALIYAAAAEIYSASPQYS